MNELNEMQKQDELKCIKLIDEIREIGRRIDAPIKIEYLDISTNRHASKHKKLVSLSELNDLNHLRHLKSTHKVLVPLLLKYLHEFKTINFKNLIVSALKVKGFYDATETLINEFNTTSLNDSYKWSIGDAFSIILDGRYEDEYIEIIKNNQNGTSRQMVTIALGKLKSDKAIPVLISLLDDEQVNGHVVIALGYYKKPEFRKYIEPFLTHKKAWIRAQAKNAIKKIESITKYSD
jgi:HEAT repeat protein